MRCVRALASFALWGAVVVGAGGMGALAAPRDHVASLSELVRGWTRPLPALPLRAAAPAASRLDAVEGLAPGIAASSRCLSPLFLALYQHDARLNQSTRGLLERAVARRAPGAASLTSPDGEFLLHYWIDPMSPDSVDPHDGDLSGTPDGVERLAAALSDVRADFVHVLKWASAPATPVAGPGRLGSTPIDVFLVGLRGQSEGPSGFTLPLHPGRAGIDEPSEEASRVAILLDAGLALPDGVMDRAALVHQAAHALLLAESARESVWWHEATAAWIEDRFASTAAAAAARFGKTPATRRSAGLGEDGLGLDLESFLWPHYLTLATTGGTDLIRRLWREMAAVEGNNTLEAMDRVLRRLHDSSLADEVRAFRVWNLFLGWADDGGRYPFARLLPTPEGDGTYEVFPARGAALSGPIAPLGWAHLRLLGDGSAGGLRIRFTGNPEGVWDIALVVHSADDPAEVHLVPVEIEEAGIATISVPWRTLAAVQVLIQNLAAPGAPLADYSFAIDHDPTLPFDLLGFSADASARGAVLSWSTEEEDRLAGWNVYRAHAPLGPFSRVNQFLLPAAGATGRPMSYVFLDSSAVAGRKNYFYLEGVTLEGFSEISHTAAVRLGARPAPLPAP